MNREVPFDNTEYCDNCGVLGAYDFMGDYLCEKCAKYFISKQSVFDDFRTNTPLVIEDDE